MEIIRINESIRDAFNDAFNFRDGEPIEWSDEDIYESLLNTTLEVGNVESDGLVWKRICYGCFSTEEYTEIEINKTDIRKLIKFLLALVEADDVPEDDSLSRKFWNSLKGDNQ